MGEYTAVKRIAQGSGSLDNVANISRLPSQSQSWNEIVRLGGSQTPSGSIQAFYPKRRNLAGIGPKWRVASLPNAVETPIVPTRRPRWNNKNPCAGVQGAGVCLRGDSGGRLSVLDHEHNHGHNHEHKRHHGWMGTKDETERGWVLYALRSGSLTCRTRGHGSPRSVHAACKLESESWPETGARTARL